LTKKQKPVKALQGFGYRSSVKLPAADILFHGEQLLFEAPGRRFIRLYKLHYTRKRGDESIGKKLFTNPPPI
jgi:hypothetical protein